ALDPEALGARARGAPGVHAVLPAGAVALAPHDHAAALRAAAGPAVRRRDRVRGLLSRAGAAAVPRPAGAAAGHGAAGPGLARRARAGAGLRRVRVAVAGV